MDRPDYPCQDAAILDSISEGVFTVDAAWRVTFFNRAAETITGVPREEAVGAYCWDVFHADACEANCPLRQTLQTGEPVANARAHIIDREGESIPIQMSTALLRDGEGSLVGGVEIFQDCRQIEALRRELTEQYSFADMVGRSPAMRALFALLPQVAESTSTVLVEGESGTGKELVARALHSLSPRQDGPFVAVNCAALPDSLLESELFGHVAGAFTDAKHDKPGRFMLANGGTLFLDEVGDISPALQVRLLRVLQERVVEPVGGITPEPVDVRVVAATNRNLAERMAAGSFREDLYYRIRVVHLTLPPLRERRADIPLLAEHFVDKFNQLQDRHLRGLDEGALAVLMAHDYPGNVRELANIIEQAFVLCRGEWIERAHLPPELRGDQSQIDRHSPLRLADMERALIAEALRRHNGNRKLAAQDLGVDPSTLYRKIRAAGLPTPATDGRGRRQ